MELATRAHQNSVKGVSRSTEDLGVGAFTKVYRNVFAYAPPCDSETEDVRILCYVPSRRSFFVIAAVWLPRGTFRCPDLAEQQRRELVNFVQTGRQ